MIAYLEGEILLIRKERVIVKAGHVGYEVFVLNPQAYQPGQAVSFFCYQQFKEDGQFLYGFEQEEQYELFTLLIQVKGVGCKTVLNMLCAMDCQTIIRAIENADTATLKKLPGIGAKTAGQIILDLKGRIVLEEKEPAARKKEKPASPVWSEVSDALLSLGYKQSEVDGLAVAPEMLASMKEDELLRHCLKQLAQNRKRRF